MKLHYWNVIIRYSIQLAQHKSLHWTFRYIWNFGFFVCVSDVVGLWWMGLERFGFEEVRILKLLGILWEVFGMNVSVKLYWVWKVKFDGLLYFSDLFLAWKILIEKLSFVQAFAWLSFKWNSDSLLVCLSVEKRIFLSPCPSVILSICLFIDRSGCWFFCSLSIVLKNN